MIATNASNIATNASNIATNTSDITTNASNIATNTSAIATNTSNIATNASNIATNTSDIATNASNIATNTSAISNKQNTLTAGTNITIVGDEISATGGGTTYSASSNGGLNLTGTEFSLDFSNTNSTIEIPQEVHIEKDGQPQLLVEPASNTGQDATIEIRGARNGSESSMNARLTLTNYDNDLGSSNYLGAIQGRVSNATSNIGGMIFDSYADGSTRTGAMSISANGNVWVGSGSSFQDFNKFQVTGNSYVNGEATSQTLRTNGTGSSATAVDIEDGVVLFDGGTGNGQTSGNGVLQIQCRSSGKLGEGICMRASGNNDNCINFRNTSDSARGRIDGNGSSRVVYRTSSDVRLKENIEDMDSCWELMKEIKPRKFRWIEDQIDDNGFIAQEIYSISGFDTIKPKEGKYECCDNSLNTFDDDGYCEYPMESEDKIYPHMLGYADFIPYLTKALKECIDRIEVLENEINELKNV